MASAGTGWQESVHPNEADEFAHYAKEFRTIQEEVRDKTHADRIFRAQHAKGVVAITHGARFQIDNELPANLTVGLFQPGRSYDAIVRFSNANPVHRPDNTNDLRGVAFRIRSDQGIDHDFLMTNAAHHHAKSVREVMAVSKAFIEPSLLTDALEVVTAGIPPPELLTRLEARITEPADKLAGVGRLFAELNEAEGPLEAAKSTKRILSTLKAQTSSIVESLATETYYSRAPLAFGPLALGNNRVALKYRLAPERPKSANPVQTDDLHTEFGERLRQGEVRFRFQGQLFVEEGRTPIEDPTHEWLESDAPFITLATLIITEQEENANVLENARFNPWNVDLSFFQPLGEFNRARRVVYPAALRSDA